MKRAIVFAALSALVLLGVLAQNPGLRLSMQSAILNNIVQQVVADVNNKILSTPIPNQSGSYGIPVLGKVWCQRMRGSHMHLREMCAVEVVGDEH